MMIYAPESKASKNRRKRERNELVINWLKSNSYAIVGMIVILATMGLLIGGNV